MTAGCLGAPSRLSRRPTAEVTLFLLSVLLACHPHVTVSYLEPAAVTLPADFTDLAVIDREQSNHSVMVAGALRGELYESTRLELVDEDAVDAALRSVDVTRPGALSATSAGVICQKSGANGLALLDSTGVQKRDAVTVRDKTVEVKGKTTTVPVYTVTRTVDTNASFSLQRCDGDVLDTKAVDASEQLSASGRTEAAARGALADDTQLIVDALSELGASYAAHIVPTWADTSRPYFRNGHADLTAGHEALQAQELAKAQKLWTRVWDTSDDDKERGRAAFDLAVLSEISGDVKVALQWAKQAKKLLGEPPIVSTYLATLRQRKVLDKVVGAQMEMEP